MREANQPPPHSNDSRDASAFLASPANDTELSWLSQLAPEESPIWIGGGRSSDDRWIMVDRAGWPLGKQPTGVGNYASTDNLGILRARPGATKLPFVIQWLRDGSNPGRLEDILQRTRETLADPSPAFPPGTLSQDDRRFCFVERPVTLDEAKALCEAAGGHLAVPASNDEAIWIQSRSKNRAADRYWIGGEFDGSGWRWSTREAWPNSDWPSGAQTGDTAAVMVRNDGWAAANPSQPADGFVIEWSDDHKKAGRGAQGIIFQRDDLKELHLKAIELIAEADEKRTGELAENAKKLVWSLQTWLGRLGGTDSARWKPHVDALIEQIQESPGHHCPKPTDFGKDSDISLSAEMMEFVEGAYLEELEIRSRYRTSVIRIRDAYATRLNEAAAEADEKGEDAAAAAIRQAAESTKNLDGWLEGMKEG